MIAIESEADVLDPQVAGGWVTWRINRQIFEPLGETIRRVEFADVELCPYAVDVICGADATVLGAGRTFEMLAGHVDNDLPL